MKTNIHSIIAGTGSYIPTIIFRNKDFLKSEFYDADGKKYNKTNEEIIQKFKEITGIEERRYVSDEFVASDIAFFSARDALESSKIDKETLDYIIFAHNFGDIKLENRRSEFVPSLASRVKNKLKIQNPKTIAYDIPFGCPGWLQGVIQANYYIKSGDAHRVMVIGAETLSRISDIHDRDSMIYSDGAGAVILDAMTNTADTGILAHASRSDTFEHINMLSMNKSYNPNYYGDELFLKMEGHKLYEYALKTVPGVVKEALEKAELSLNDVNKIIIHQANEKLDEGILKRIYGKEKIPEDIMPMTISWLGNSSVATLPTLLDFLVKRKLNAHELNKGDILVFASVGAGMNINALVYRIPYVRN